MTIIEAKEGFTFGCDPELFIINEDTEEFVCAEGMIPGTKEEPFKVERGAVQVDGMAAEFNIDPVDNFKDWNDSIRDVQRQLRAMLPKGYNLVALPSVSFSKDVWDNSPSTAKMLGCSPDFNAWTGSINPSPHDPSNPYLRTASGHIHVGWTDDADTTDIQHIMTCRDFVKQLDWYLGGWSLTKDKDSNRRRLYGNAGACRFKPYGVEYRVLSNFWISSAVRRKEVWNRLQSAIYDMRNSFLPEIAVHWDMNNKLIESINTSTRNPDLEAYFKFPVLKLP